MPAPPTRRRRIVVLIALACALLALVAVGLRPEHRLAVPDGASAGSLRTKPCTYDTEDGPLAADCGTLVVPEDRADPDSELLALPVTRIKAASGAAGTPVFRLGGGPGLSNTDFPQASRLNRDRDVVLVGYRGVDGSRRLDCPEVTAVMQSSGDLTAPDALPLTSRAFARCAERLSEDGVDLTAYTIAERIEDVEDAREAFGYNRIDLLSSSAGTRTAMVYAQLHPDSLERSAMISVNPPGHLFWDPQTTDSQFQQYADLCRQDTTCSARTPDLAASVREATADVPERWGPFAIGDSTVRVLSQYAMHMNGPAAAPNNAPTALDALTSRDPGALWAMSVLGNTVLPTSIVWGEFASFAMVDAPAVQRFYAAGGGPDSTLGTAPTDFLWGGPAGVSTVWPDSPDNAQYRQLRPTDVETLLVGGELDFSTPPVNATRELLPLLTHGQEVVLPGLGHTGDFWEHQPEAGEQLLNGFYDTGQVDASAFQRRPVGFDDVPLSMSTIARLLIAITSAAALIGLFLLGALARRRLRGDAPGRRASVWTRVLTVVPLGLAGWSMGALVNWMVDPGDFMASASVVVPGAALLIGLGTHLAAPGGPAGSLGRPTHAAATVVGALLGGFLGATALPGLLSPAGAVLGAALGANLVLTVLDLRSSASTSATSAPA